MIVEQCPASFVYCQNFTGMIKSTKGLILDSLSVYRKDSDGTLAEKVSFNIQCSPGADIIITPTERLYIKTAVKEPEAEYCIIGQRYLPNVRRITIPKENFIGQTDDDGGNVCIYYQEDNEND